MYYNNTKIEVNLKTLEDFMTGCNLAIDMWTDDYYELLSLIGDEYEWSLNKQSSSPSSGWWGCFLLPQYGNEQTVSPTNTMREQRWIDPEDHAKQVVEQFTLDDLIEYVTQDLVEMYSDMGEWEYADELKRWYDEWHN